jgi:hypothetical protein
MTMAMNTATHRQGMGKQIRCLRNLAATIAMVYGLASCGDSGSVNTVAPPSQKTGTLQAIGKSYDPATVLSTACTNPLDPAKMGLAAQARYPKASGVFRGWPSTGSNTPSDYGTPLQLRSDRADGFVVSHATNLNGAMFQVGADGGKTILPLPYASVFDVAADGSIWLVSAGTLSVGARNGSVTNLAPELGKTLPADGVLGSSPTGKIGLIAAGRDRVYLLVEQGGIDLGTAPPSSNITRSLRVLSRATPGNGAWTVRTVPLFDGLQGIDVISSMRVGPSDELVLLLNRPFQRLVSQQFAEPGQVPTSYEYEGVASVRVLDTADRWTELASTFFSVTVSRNNTHGYLGYAYSFDMKDLSVTADGRVWVGGTGAIYSVNAINGWQLAATPNGSPFDYVAHDGPITNATFANAGQIVADQDGVTFYDGETCQIRRLKAGQVSTVSGPMLDGPSFAGAGFIGTTSGGELLFAYGNSSDPAVNAVAGHYQSLFGLSKAKLDDPLFTPTKLGSLASAVGPASCVAGASYWVWASCAGAPSSTYPQFGTWLGQSPSGPVARIGSSIYLGLDTGRGTVVGSTSNWPGILTGDAPSGPSGVHVDGGKLYMFGWVRTDPPVLFPVTYHELRIYQLDLTTGIASPLAGASIASTAYRGQKVDLSPVIPTAGGGPALIQRRSDGKFWLSNGKELWILDDTGQLRRIAGLSTSGRGIDGIGNAVSFALIGSLRVLPDNRLLVVDQAAHAVRLASDDGKVATIVGQLNQSGNAFGSLPGGLDTPLDAYAIGKNVYISTQASRKLLLASEVLQ